MHRQKPRPHPTLHNPAPKFFLFLTLHPHVAIATSHTLIQFSPHTFQFLNDPPNITLSVNSQGPHRQQKGLIDWSIPKTQTLGLPKPIPGELHPWWSIKIMSSQQQHRDQLPLLHLQMPSTPLHSTHSLSSAQTKLPLSFQAAPLQMNLSYNPAPNPLSENPEAWWPAALVAIRGRWQRVAACTHRLGPNQWSSSSTDARIHTGAT
jgi:hypothetical protein